MKSELLNEAEYPDEGPTSDESGEIDESSGDEGSLDGFDDETTAKVAFSSVVDCIDRLFRLSMKVRNPTMRTGLSKGLSFRRIDDETGLDLFDRFADLKIDEGHIENLFRAHYLGRISYLIARLTKANIQRRRQFAYWSQHRLKLGKFCEKVNIIQGQRIQIPALVGVSAVSQYSKPTTATQLVHGKISLDDDAQSAISTVSVNLPELTDSFCDFDTFPDPPSNSGAQKDLKEFECPYCYTVCSYRLLNRRKWRHVYRFDIRAIAHTWQSSYLERHSSLYMHFRRLRHRSSTLR